MVASLHQQVGEHLNEEWYSKTGMIESTRSLWSAPDVRIPSKKDESSCLDGQLSMRAERYVIAGSWQCESNREIGRNDSEFSTNLTK